MTDRFEPAWNANMLSWWGRDPDEVRYQLGVGMDHVSYSLKCDLPRLIALANAALPDPDPRKITREWIEVIRAAARDAVCGIEDASLVQAAERHAMALTAIADALESYLPPE